MRCNRCGNPLDPRDTRCAVCGKVLVPPTKKRPPAQKPGETQNIKLPQLDKFTHTYNRDAARSHSFHTLTLLAAAVVLVLLVLVYMGVGDLKDAVAQMHQSTDSQLAALQQNLVVLPSEEPTEEQATEPPVEEAPAKPLSRQNLKANVSLHRHGDGTYAAASMDLDTFEDEAMCWVVTGSHKTHVQWTLTNAGDRLELVVSDAYAAAESKLTMGMTWSFGGDTFALLMDSACSWECRMSGGEWGTIPEEYVVVESGTSTLTLTAEALDLLMAQYDEMELRCQFTLKHPDGGSVTVTADGMTVTREGLVTFANKPG